MPVQTPEQVASKVERARKRLEAIGDDAEAANRRVARKKLKRAQRKRRRLARAAERRGGGASEAKQE